MPEAQKCATLYIFFFESFEVGETISCGREEELSQTWFFSLTIALSRLCFFSSECWTESKTVIASVLLLARLLA